MNDIQKAWIAYLRANPEKQTRGCLHDADGRMCCLGAAAQVLMDSGDQSISWQDIGGGPKQLTDLTSKAHERLMLLPRVVDAFGLFTPCGALDKQVAMNIHGVRGNVAALAEMNDRGMTWPEIADYIEENPENVFINHEVG